MEKKNTMLLTVIAVATLLVAVVGATFAYFSLTVDNQSTATTASVKTASAATAILTGTDQKLHLKIAGSDMVKGETATYYAISESEETPQYDGNATSIYSKDTPKEYEIAKITLNGADTTLKYTCGYKVTIDTTEDLTGLTTGDLVLTLKIGKTSSESPQTIDLNQLTSSQGKYSKTIDGTFELTSGNTEEHILASLALKNTELDQTTALAGKDLTINITAAGDGNACTIAKLGD